MAVERSSARGLDSLHLGDSEAALWSDDGTIHAPSHPKAVIEGRIVLKLDHDEAGNGLDDHSLQTDQTPSTVIFQHTNPCTSDEV